MKRLIASTLLSLAVILTAPASVSAQLVNFTASNISVGGQKLAAGQICVQPVDATNHPMIARLGGSGGGAIVTEASCAAVTNGVIAGGFTAPDTYITSPQNVCLRVTIT